METLWTNNQHLKLLDGTTDNRQTSGQQPGGRWFKSNPHHQDKAKGSNNAPLQFFGATIY